MLLKLSLYFFLAFNAVHTFAQNCNLAGDDAPDPASLACFLGRIFNIGYYIVGIVAVAVIAYGAIKLAMSLGDPKGLAGAQQTWLYAFIGIAVVVFAGAILIIIGKLIGIDLDPNSLIGSLGTSLTELLDFAVTGE